MLTNACELGLTSMFITYLTSQNLILDKVCRVNLNYSDEICDAQAERNPNGTDYEEVLEAVQEYVASINVWKFFVGKVQSTLQQRTIEN